jgi:hypothetical protein
MGVGLEVYDASGNAIFSTSDRLARFLGSVTTNAGNGNINIAEFNQGTPFGIFVPTQTGDFFSPRIYFSGTTMFWEYISTAVHGVIYYGVR